jgi:hypothetical protein
LTTTEKNKAPGLVRRPRKIFLAPAHASKRLIGGFSDLAAYVPTRTRLAAKEERD